MEKLEILDNGLRWIVIHSEPESIEFIVAENALKELYRLKGEEDDR